MLKLLLKLFILLASLLSQYSYAANHETVVKIAMIDWCPALCPGQQDPGYIFEIVNQVFKNSPYQLKFSVMPWPRAIEEVELGRHHALLSPVKQEAPQLLYPANELGIQETCFYVSADDSWMFDGAASLFKNRRIGYIKNNSILEYDVLIGDNPSIFIPLRDTKFLSRAMQMVQSNRLNTYIYTKNEAEYYFKKNDIIGQYKNAGCVRGAKLYLAFSPNNHKSAELIKYFDQQMVKIYGSIFLSRALKTYNLKNWR